MHAVHLSKNVRLLKRPQGEEGGVEGQAGPTDRVTVTPRQLQMCTESEVDIPETPEGMASWHAARACRLNKAKKRTSACTHDGT